MGKMKSGHLIKADMFISRCQEMSARKYLLAYALRDLDSVCTQQDEKYVYLTVGRIYMTVIYMKSIKSPKFRELWLGVEF